MLFRKQKKETPLYAIHTGTFAGEMWCFIKKENNKHYFISIPNLEKREIDSNIFESGIKSEIVKFVEHLPQDIYKIIEKQYNHTTK